MLHTINKRKSFNKAKYAVVSSALLGNLVLAGCNTTADIYRMDTNKSSNELNEENGGIKAMSKAASKRSKYTNETEGTKDSTNKNSLWKMMAIGFIGLAAGSLGFGVGFGVPYGQRGNEIDNLNRQIAYLQDQVDSAYSADHFETLNVSVLVNGTKVPINYLNVMNYYRTNLPIEFVVDQSSSIGLQSIPVVSDFLEPTGPVQVTLLPTNDATCGWRFIDLSKLELASEISLSGNQYLPIMGPQDRIDTTPVDTSTTAATSIYNLRNGYFNLTGLEPCAGSVSSFTGVGALLPGRSSSYIFDTSTPPSPLVTKLDGNHIMSYDDLNTCYSDLLYEAGFSTGGTLPSGRTYTAGQYLQVANDVPSTSVIYDLATQMTNLSMVEVFSTSLSGNQVEKLVENLNNAGDALCIQSADIVGPFTVPQNTFLDCTPFACTNVTNSNTCGWRGANFLNNCQLNNVQITVNSAVGDTIQSRINIVGPVPAIGATANSWIKWANGTSFAITPTNIEYTWPQTTNFQGECSISA